MIEGQAEDIDGFDSAYQYITNQVRVMAGILQAINTDDTIALMVCLMVAYSICQRVLFALSTGAMANNIANDMTDDMRRVPTPHWLARYTPAWIRYQRFTGNARRLLLQAHRKHGAVLLVAPRELSINCVSYGTDTVSRFEKTDYYSQFANYGHPNTFSTVCPKAHATARQRYSRVYKKSFLYHNGVLGEILRSYAVFDFLPAVSRSLLFVEPALNQPTSKEQSMKQNNPIRIRQLFNAWTMDVTTAYIFGISNGTKWMQLKNDQTSIQEFIRLSKPHWLSYLRRNFPYVTLGLERLGILTRIGGITGFRHAKVALEKWCINMCERVELGEAAGEHAVVYQSMTDEIIPSLYKHYGTTNSTSQGEQNTAAIDHRICRDAREKIASELLNHIIAAHISIPIVLTFATLELSLHKKSQERLQQEISALAHTHGGDHIGRTQLERIDRLPFLTSVVRETLRLYVSDTDGEPRMTPPGRFSRLGQFTRIPPGMEVSATAYMLHRDTEIFPDQETWDPMRWMESGDHDRWFWSFGGGTRGCPAENLSMLVIKYALLTLYTTYDTVLVGDRCGKAPRDDSESMKQVDPLFYLIKR